MEDKICLAFSNCFCVSSALPSSFFFSFFSPSFLSPCSIPSKKPSFTLLHQKTKLETNKPPKIANVPFLA